MHFDSRFDWLIDRESNAVHFYEKDLITGSSSSGYTGRRRYPRSSRNTAGSLPAVDNVFQNPAHLPGVQLASATVAPDNSGESREEIPSLAAASPDAVLEQFGSRMSSYERREVYNYPAVYFVGASAAKRCGVAGAPNNDGYDDDHGAYIQVFTSDVSKARWHRQDFVTGGKWGMGL